MAKLHEECVLYKRGSSERFILVVIRLSLRDKLQINKMIPGKIVFQLFIILFVMNYSLGGRQRSLSSESGNSRPARSKNIGYSQDAELNHLPGAKKKGKKSEEPVEISLSGGTVPGNAVSDSETDTESKSENSTRKKTFKKRSQKQSESYKENFLKGLTEKAKSKTFFITGEDCAHGRGNIYQKYVLCTWKMK